jgi:two-component system sensor histidine kinase QseC
VTRLFRAGWSLRRALLAVLLALTVSVWVFSAVVVYFEADQESQELFDQSLAETAQLLLALADHEIEERIAMGGGHESAPIKNAHGEYLLFQMWDNTGRLLYKNQGAPDKPFVAGGASGFGESVVEGKSWRTYAAWNADGRLQIQVGEPDSHRNQISERFAWKLLLFVLVVIPLMALAIWWIINRAFRTLQVSADEVSRHTPADLYEVSLVGVPSEVQPLLQAINRLIDRMRSTLEHEQRFTADAAHELRTPLAAIKTNLQVIQRARNDGERDEFIDALGISVDRATRLVGQLMALSRLDPQYDNQQVPVRVDLAVLLSAQLLDWVLQAERLQLQLTADLKPAWCQIHQDSFLILLRNLLDNALRYTPPGGVIQIACHAANGAAYLSVADSGPGIPVEMRERVFDRFVRLADAGKPGSGLGLSLVKRIAEAHGARLVLREGLYGAGLTVQVEFPNSGENYAAAQR